MLVGPALPLGDPSPERAAIDERFAEPNSEPATGWDKYNLDYWHDHYEDFVAFFFDQAFTERYSTKAKEDLVGPGPGAIQLVAPRLHHKDGVTMKQQSGSGTSPHPSGWVMRAATWRSRPNCGSVVPTSRSTGWPMIP
ncbi:hypothetical protein BH24ACT15_BH24ACT15_21130 [soil metagenome]